MAKINPRDKQRIFDAEPRREMSDENMGAAAYRGTPLSRREVAMPDSVGGTSSGGRLIKPRHSYSDGTVVPQSPPNVPVMSDENEGAAVYRHHRLPARRRVQGIESFE